MRNIIPHLRPFRGAPPRYFTTKNKFSDLFDEHDLLNSQRHSSNSDAAQQTLPEPSPFVRKNYKKDLTLTFLGTSSANPTRSRNLSSLAMVFDNSEMWLFDCGDGTLKQLTSSVHFMLRPCTIFITHLHEDHVLGLASIIKASLSSLGTKSLNVPLTIVGPAGLADLFSPIIHFYELGKIHFVEIVPVDAIGRQTSPPCPSKGKKLVTMTAVLPCAGDNVYNAYENEFFKVTAVPIKHSCFCLGYVVTEKIHAPGMVPRKIAVLGDTCHPYSMAEHAKNVDILVHECTFLACERYRADLTCHSTTEMVGSFAKAVQPRQLILNHFSKRYFLHENGYCEPHTDLLLAEVKGYLGWDSPCTVSAAKDLTSYSVSSKTVSEKSEWTCEGKTGEPIVPFYRNPKNITDQSILVSSLDA